MKNRIKFCVVTVFMFISFVSVVLANDLQIRSESPNFSDKDTSLIEKSLIKISGDYRAEVIILTMNNKSEIYSRNKDGKVVMEEKQAYIRFMITVLEGDAKKSVKFIELFAPSRKDLVFRTIRTINHELKDI
ncbi:MAG: hypothetical protein JXK07_15615 [Spirochaetes bacterium]|nr:hypothetical protein [Spirochaetota bacterium]MBN2769611.1 hypothetical protein [Spirochaetota bacterium]